MLRSTFFFLFAFLFFQNIQAQGGAIDLEGQPGETPLQSVDNFFNEKFEISVFPPFDSLGKASDSLAQIAIDAAIERAVEIENNVERDLELLRKKAETDEAIVPGDDLWFILNFAMDTRHQSEGTFEVTMGKLEKLWRTTAKERKKPTRKEIKKLRWIAGMNHLEISKEGTIKLLHPKVPIDIKPLALGYSLDCMADVFYDAGLKGFFIKTGNMAVAGEIPEKAKESWKYNRPVFIDGSKRKKETPIWNSAIVTTQPEALFEKYGDTFYDLVDPVRGNVIRHNSIVTVEAASAMKAYAWAMALTINYDEEFYDWVRGQDTRVWYSEP